MTYYTLEACESLIRQYCEHGGDVVTVEEGTLGLGIVVCHGYGLKTSIITEVYQNEWSSVHKIRMYKNMPKKYAAMLEKIEYAD